MQSEGNVVFFAIAQDDITGEGAAGAAKRYRNRPCSEGSCTRTAMGKGERFAGETVAVHHPLKVIAQLDILVGLPQVGAGVITVFGGDGNDLNVAVAV